LKKISKEISTKFGIGCHQEATFLLQ